MASGASRCSSRYLFPQITAVCAVPDGSAGARSLSKASVAIWPWEWRNAQPGTSCYCLTQVKTQTRSHLKDPFIIMGVVLSHRPPEVEVGQSGPSSKQPESTCSSYRSPRWATLQKTHLFSFSFLGEYPPLFLWSAALLVFIDWRERSSSCLRQVAEQLMTIAYESGVNLFDTAEVYSGGKWVMISRSVLHRRRNATFREADPSVQGQEGILYTICIILLMTRGSPWCSQLCRPNLCLWIKGDRIRLWGQESLFNGCQ